MEIRYSADLPAASEACIHFLAKEDRAAPPIPLSEAEFSGKPNSTVFLHGEKRLFVGLGETAKIDGQVIRAASAVAARSVQRAGRTHVALDLGAWGRFAGEAVEGILAGSYAFDRFKREEPDAKLDRLESLTILSKSGDLEETSRLGDFGRILGESVNAAREMGNQPPNLFFPETFAEAARQLAREHGLSVDIFDERRLLEGGFGGLLAVGAGSVHPPRLIVLRHDGGPADEPPLVFVGKAITFDSGGLSIKPAQGMEEMVWDKCGGTAVFGAMRGVAALRPARNVAAVIASAENMTGPAAYRPGDIITVYGGQHIEINNTDAEGRVVLADALGYASKTLKAGAIIDLATLTGGCVVALGEETAGLWCADEPLRRRVLAASEKAGDPLWPMPITQEHRDKIKSDIALIKNSSGREGSPCTAAAFLQSFVGETPWAHIDLAGPSATTKDRPGQARGATGFGVRTLLQLAAG